MFLSFLSFCYFSLSQQNFDDQLGPPPPFQERKDYNESIKFPHKNFIVVQPNSSLKIEPTSLYVLDCYFSNLTETSNGGAFSFVDPLNFPNLKAIYIQSCGFSSCFAEEGGAIYIEIPNENNIECYLSKLCGYSCRAKLANQLDAVLCNYDSLNANVFNESSIACCINDEADSQSTSLHFYGFNSFTHLNFTNNRVDICSTMHVALSKDYTEQIVTTAIMVFCSFSNNTAKQYTTLTIIALSTPYSYIEFTNVIANTQDLDQQMGIFIIDVPTTLKFCSIYDNIAPSVFSSYFGMTPNVESCFIDQPYKAPRGSKDNLFKPEFEDGDSNITLTSPINSTVYYPICLQGKEIKRLNNEQNDAVIFTKPPTSTKEPTPEPPTLPPLEEPTKDTFNPPSINPITKIPPSNIPSTPSSIITTPTDDPITKITPTEITSQPTMNTSPSDDEDDPFLPTINTLIPQPPQPDTPPPPPSKDNGDLLDQPNDQISDDNAYEKKVIIISFSVIGSVLAIFIIIAVIIVIRRKQKAKLRNQKKNKKKHHRRHQPQIPINP